MDEYAQDAALVLCERRSRRHEMNFFLTTFNEITRRGREQRRAEQELCICKDTGRRRGESLQSRSAARAQKGEREVPAAANGGLVGTTERAAVFLHY